jgi:putative drug exporter of the RND superfamily
VIFVPVPTRVVGNPDRSTRRSLMSGSTATNRTAHHDATGTATIHPDTGGVPAEVAPQPAARPRGRRRAVPRRGPTAWCVDHPWRALLAAVLVLAGAVVLLAGGLTTTKPAGQLVGDSAVAEKLRNATDFGQRPIENVVVTPLHGRLDPAAVSRLSVELATAYTGLKGVAAVGRPVLSSDGSTLLLPVGLNAVSTGAAAPPPGAVAPADAVGPMLAATARIAAAHPQLRVGQVGPGSIESEVGRRLDQDFRRAELVSLPVTLAILLVAFGAVVAAGVPVLLGIGAVVAALGLTGYASRTLTPVDQNTESLVLLIGLAVGVDYALFVIRRAREERAAGASVRESVLTAGATAGRAVVISGVTVVVAMSGMLVAGGLFTSLAIGAMLVVAVAVLASATVLPAMLALLGDRVESLRLPFSRRREIRRGRTDGGWGRLAARVTARPLAWTVAAGGLLVLLAVPALGMRTSLPGDEELPKSFASVAALTQLTAAFPQHGTTVDVLVKAPRSASGQVTTALAAGYRAGLATGTLVGPRPDVVTSTDGTVHVLALPVALTQSDPALARTVDLLRARVTPAVRADLFGVDAQVHLGGAAAATDLSGWMAERLPWVVGFVLVLTFVVMLVSFGSLWLSAATVVLNLLSVGAAYGVMTLVFQHTWAQGLLDFTSVGSIAAWLPLLMFVILFGLSMDYHVFVVSRVREAWSTGVGPREAVRLGVSRSAGVVTSAATVMVAVFAIFATLSSLEMKQLGVGLATAVLVDATVVRGVLLPAVLALLGRRAHTGPRWIPVMQH